MKYLLDTNVCIDAMRGRSEVVSRLRSMSPDDCAISTVSLFELHSGALMSARPLEDGRKVSMFTETFVLLPWDSEAARYAAGVRRNLESLGLRIGACDTLLAGHALALGIPIVTDNVREFGRVTGLKVENWRRR